MAVQIGLDSSDSSMDVTSDGSALLHSASKLTPLLISMLSVSKRKLTGTKVSGRQQFLGKIYMLWTLQLGEKMSSELGHI